MPITAVRSSAQLQNVAAAALPDVLVQLSTSPNGLSTDEARMRLDRFGPNAIRTHHVSVTAVLKSQLNNAVLALLAATAVISFFLGDRTQATIIGIILVISIGLGFINEYRAERASAELHSRVRHTVDTPIGYTAGPRIGHVHLPSAMVSSKPPARQA